MFQVRNEEQFSGRQLPVTPVLLIGKSPTSHYSPAKNHQSIIVKHPQPAMKSLTNMNHVVKQGKTADQHGELDVLVLRHQIALP